MNYFKLYANCILVRGIKNSLIYDLYLGRYYTLPEELAVLLEELESNSYENTLKIHHEYQSEITSFCEELIELGYADWFRKEELNLYVKMNLDWDYPAQITNIIVEHENEQVIKDVLFICDELLTHAVLIKHKGKINNLLLRLKCFDDSIVSQIEIITDNFIFQDLKNKDSVRLKNIWVKNFNKKNQVVNEKIKALSKRRYFKQERPRMDLFTESQKHHAYFNRKLYIGTKGEIKNAPECEEEFGNINEIKNIEDLKTIISSSEFQKYWLVHKEMCDVCKDCEFRHMCVDNRVPSQRKDGSWYHQQECNYNPYISKWKGEEGYQNLRDIGVVSDKKIYHRDDEKITAINEVLWSK